MGRELARLTAVQVRSLGQGLHADGGGLFLHVQGGRRSWVFVWKRHGKQHRRGLGSVNVRSLARARELAAGLRTALADGRHPDEVLGRLAQDGAPIPTVAEAAERMIQDRAAGWRNPKHAQQWRNSLRDYVLPLIGTKRPADVTLEDVLAILKPIWTVKTETATRVRQRLEAVLDYCAVHGWREESNPARWKGRLDKLLPKPEKLKKQQHFAALDYRKLPELMAALRERTSSAALCLRYIILTACRSSEARGATWGEIDLQARIWTVPGQRMKAGRPHRVPLSEAALEVLQQAAALRQAHSDVIFPSPTTGKALSDVSVSKLLHELVPGVTVHGMRAAFKTWASEEGRYPARVVENALAHVNPDKTEAAYERTDQLELRRALMEDWARHCATAASAVLPEA